MRRIAIGGIEHLEVTPHMLGLPLLLIVALGGIHVTTIFGDHVRHDAIEPCHFLLGPECRARAVAAQLLVAENEVVHGVNVFEELALRDVAHAVQVRLDLSGALRGAVALHEPGAGDGTDLVLAEVEDAACAQNRHSKIRLSPRNRFNK